MPRLHALILAVICSACGPGGEATLILHSGGSIGGLAENADVNCHILQQAVAGLTLQLAYADIVIQQSVRRPIFVLAADIHALSQRGQKSIRDWAHGKNCQTDVTLDEAATQRIQTLAKKSGRDLETTYVLYQAERLQAARQEAEAAIGSATDADVRAFAERSVPEISALYARVCQVANSTF